MKNASIAAILFGLCSSMASAGEMKVKGEVIGAQTQIKVNGHGPRAVQGYGAAGGIELGLSDSLNLGLRAGHLKHGDWDKRTAQDFTDSFAGAQVSYDFLKTSGLSLYALGGASYHIVNFEDEKSNGVRFKTADAYLWNWDAGLGGRYALTDSVALGLEYRYTDTFRKDDVNASVSSDKAYVAGSLDNVSLKSQQVAVSLSYAF